jgi:SPP1 gp7 family putative phage head morphogenesis protein
MAKKLDQLAKENQRLLDMLFRHQLYLEGVKSSFAGQYTIVLKELYDAFAKYFGQMRYTSMDQFTKRELADFIRLFQKEQQRFYSIYTEQLIKALKQFLAADLEVTQAIYESTVVKRYQIPDSPKPEDDNAVSIYGDAAISGTKEGTVKLWAAISNDPVPASGRLFPKEITDFINNTGYAIASTLRKGYANAWTGQEALLAMIGSSSRNFNDGLFAKFSNQNIALINTVIQHVSSATQGAIGSSYTSKYEWVAVLDNRTTEICWNRNGTIYVYGEGPLPPAHYNCRSKAIALLPGMTGFDIPTSYVEWLKGQTDLFQNDLLGEAKAAQLRNGSLDLKQIGSIKPLSIPQFVSKIPYILGE